jgi:hypothetical protein
MEQTPEARRRRDLLLMREKRRRYERERATVRTRSALLRASAHQTRGC